MQTIYEPLILIIASMALQVSLADDRTSDLALGRDALGREDIVTAMAHLETAARDGSAEAQALLGYIYDKAEDNATAASWYRKAAAQDHPDGLFGLGEIYLSGDGVARDVEQGRHFMTRAAELGHVKSMVALGHQYEYDMPTSASLAVHWYRRAADAGDRFAAARLARAYAQGELDLPQDAEKSRQYQVAAGKDKS